MGSGCESNGSTRKLFLIVEHFWLFCCLKMRWCIFCLLNILPWLLIIFELLTSAVQYRYSLILIPLYICLISDCKWKMIAPLVRWLFCLVHVRAYIIHTIHTYDRWTFIGNLLHRSLLVSVLLFIQPYFFCLFCSFFRIEC